MATYNLRNGHTVKTSPAPADRTEFVTSNAGGEVVSTVTLPREESRELVIGLRTAAALRRA